MSTTGTQELVVDIPTGEWITSNMRLHPMEKASRTRALRRRAGMLARSKLQVPPWPVLVVAESHYRSGRGLDADACAPSVKAIVDGMVDAKLFPDDDGDHVGGILYQRSKRDTNLRKGWHAIRLLLITQYTPF